MKDWRDNGKKIRADLDAQYKKLGEEVARVFKSALERPPTDDSLLYEALRDHANGDSSALIEYLRSDRPLQREWLAQTLEGEFTPKSGRPRNKDLRSATLVARVFYRRWKEANKRDGINDRGLSGLMKDESCRHAHELESRLQADIDTVREMKDRPISRRN